MSQQHDDRARETIKELLAGNPPPPASDQAEYGPWAEAIDILLEAHRDGGYAGVRQAWSILARTDPNLVKLYAAAGPPPLEGATVAVRKLVTLGIIWPGPKAKFGRLGLRISHFRQPIGLHKAGCKS